MMLSYSRAIMPRATAWATKKAPRRNSLKHVVDAAGKMAKDECGSVFTLRGIGVDRCVGPGELRGSKAGAVGVSDEDVGGTSNAESMDDEISDHACAEDECGLAGLEL